MRSTIFMTEKNIQNAINTPSKWRSVNKVVSHFEVNYIIALKLVTLHQHAKIICLLSREVIDHKIDKELAKKKKKLAKYSACDTQQRTNNVA